MTETPMMYDLDAAGDEGFQAAADAVGAGECVVLPTDTVYGIAADPFKARAVKRLLDAKQRGEQQPPPVLIAEPSMLRVFTTDVPQSARQLAAKFWPGGLTLILKTQKSLNLKIGETGGTVAVRVPDNEHARTLLRRTGPLAVSSANLSGRPPATTCEQAREALGESVVVYLDGGETPGLTPSTIVDFTRFRGGQVVREGVLSYDELKAVALRLKPMETDDPEELEAPEEPLAIEAPDEAAALTETAESTDVIESAEVAEPAESTDASDQ